MPRVIVMWSPGPRQVVERAVDLPEGATVADALRAGGWSAADLPPGDGQAQTGIWGRRCAPTQPVRDGDRVEVHRALRVDPKVARRERFSKQGARAAGLFAQRRPGGKAGY